TRDAAIEALAELPIGRLGFYEDLPYAAKLHGIGDFSQILPHCHLRAECADVKEVIDWKLELTRVYFSQFTWSQVAQLGDYATCGGRGRAVEGFWRASSQTAITAEGSSAHAS